ncbi:MAG: hypothetical protein ACRDUA_17275 [Micromonosporaceae bacterium]
MRAPTGTLRLFGLFVAFGLLALAGCSDDPDKPSTLPDDTPSVLSSSPTPDTPEEQVEAAVRAYYAELTRAAQTNETTRLKSMVTRGCPCYRPIRVIEKGAARGEITPDAEWTIESVRVHDIEGETAVADVRYEVSAYDVVDTDGNVLGRVEAQRSHYDLSLVRAPSGWVIGNLFNLEG